MRRCIGQMLSDSSPRRLRSRLLAMALLAVVSLLLAASGTAADGGQTRLLVKFAPGASLLHRSTTLEAANGKKVSSISGIGVDVVSVPAAAAASSLARLKNAPGVQFAELDAMRAAQETLPSDPSFPKQFAIGGGAWGWYKTRTTQAWGITKGSSSVVVAILDTGLKTAGLDDYSGQLVSGRNVLNGSSDTASMAGYHGTYVAGVAGLALNNGDGNAGFCPLCKIMPVQVGTDSGASDANIANGITWAADHEARVINLSWAGPGSSQTIQSAIDYAHSKGLVVVAAAGNSNCDCPQYPAASNHVLGVAGTTSTDAKEGDSNYGNWVKIAAPESNMTSWPTINGGPGYAPVGGTSLASPVVAGIAALMFSANPGLTNTQVEQALTQTAVPLGFPVASGRVDALAALNSVGFSDPQPASVPVNTAQPKIYIETNGDWNYTPLGTSAPQIGEALLRGQGSWTGSAPLSINVVKWLRCDSAGANCTTVGTSAKYTVQATDAGYRLQLSISVKNDLGTTTVLSSLSAAVGGAPSPPPPPPPSPPVNTSLPVLSGTPQDGKTLQATAGTWTNASTFANQWLRCDSAGANCAAIAGATAWSYKLTSVDVGKTIRAQTTATNGAGQAIAQSAPTAVVAAAPPQSTSSPAISGTTKPDQVLNATAGTWTGTSPMSYANQWLRCDSAGANCAAIAGATAWSYKLVSADVGKTIRAQTTATNGAGQAIATSSQTALVTNVMTVTGTLTKNTTSLAFPLSFGAGQASATLTFSKQALMTVKLVDSTGATVGEASGATSPISFDVSSLPAGSYTYVVSGSGYKGTLSFSLSVTAPSP